MEERLWSLGLITLVAIPHLFLLTRNRLVLPLGAPAMPNRSPSPPAVMIRALDFAVLPQTRRRLHRLRDTGRDFSVLSQHPDYDNLFTGLHPSPRS